MADDAGQPLSLRDRIRQLEQAANSPLQQPPASLAPSSSSSPPLRPAPSALQATRTAATASEDVRDTGDEARRTGGATRRTPSPSPPRPQFAQLRAIYNQSSAPSSSPAKGLKTESVKADPLSAAEAPVKAVEVPQAGGPSASASGAPASPVKPRPLWAHEKRKADVALAQEAEQVMADPKDARKDEEVSKESDYRDRTISDSQLSSVKYIAVSLSFIPSSLRNSQYPFPLTSTTTAAPPVFHARRSTTSQRRQHESRAPASTFANHHRLARTQLTRQTTRPSSTSRLDSTARIRQSRLNSYLITRSSRSRRLTTLVVDSPSPTD
ncbi:EH domain-containing protein [Rhodotorula toruloides]|nr:EH domain-containing protein [Rhodotorula toruloides]